MWLFGRGFNGNIERDTRNSGLNGRVVDWERVRVRSQDHVQAERVEESPVVTIVVLVSLALGFWSSVPLSSAAALMLVLDFDLHVVGGQLLRTAAVGEHTCLQ